MSRDGSESAIFSGSSLEHYFETFVPKITQVLRHHDCEIDLGRDPCDQLVNVSREERIDKVDKAQQEETCNGIENLDELKTIVDIFKADNSYSHKIADIMLKRLIADLGISHYKLFLEEGFPKNAIIIVKSNSDNTPYLEYLLKSDGADESPFDQINNFSATHAIYGDYVVEYLRSYARKKLQSVKESTRPTTQAIKQKKIVTATKTRRSGEQDEIAMPLSSTPKSYRSPPTSNRKPQSLDNSLNDSRRILPQRACKSLRIANPYRK